jgi:membrane associated rhomboid family serine protease
MFGSFGNSGFSSIPPVVKNLIIINVIMVLATWVASVTFKVDLVSILGLFYPGSSHFQPYQFVTHMFMHSPIYIKGGIFHVIFNMYALYMFGRVLEMVWGGKRFLIYYLATGLGAVALHTFVNYIIISGIQSSATAMLNTLSPETFAAFVTKHFPELYNTLYDTFLGAWYAAPQNMAYANAATEYTRQLIELKMNIPTVGASGAVFGVLLAFGMYFPNTQLMMLFIPFPIKAKYFVMGYGAIELYLGFAQPGSNIAHFAHLGGMLFGFILIKLWAHRRDKFY